jgi:hypothetical protein
MNNKQAPFVVGDWVRFWTGRGSRGGAVIRELRDGRAFLDPNPDAENGDPAYADALFRRYCDWSRVDAEITAHVPAQLAD